MSFGSAVAGCAREAWFWMTLPLVLLRRHGGAVLAAVGVAIAAGAFGYVGAVRLSLIGLAVIVVALRAWWHLAPASFEARLTGPYRRRLIRGHVQQSWPLVCQRAGLTFSVAAKRRGDPTVQVVPQLQVRWVDGRLCLSPQMLAGHDLTAWETAAEAIRVAAGAS